MKKIKSWLTWIIFFFMFGFNPIFYIVFFVYIIYKLNQKINKNIATFNTFPNEQIKTLNKNNIILKCVKCDAVLTVNHKFCNNCGAEITDNNIKVEPVAEGENQSPLKTIVNSDNFDAMFQLSEDELLSEFLVRELKKSGLDENSKLIPRDILKKRIILNIILSCLIFCLISLIFFHFPILTYKIGVIIIFVAYKITKRYNFLSYLKKQIKSRPNEKVSNIIMTYKQTMETDTSGRILFLGIIFSILIPLIIFSRPMIWYEKVDGGYGVRYYIFGVTNFTSATIPAEHNGENVVLLRGNTFSNMPFLKEVNLPDTITEIRGQAFKNNRNLKTVNLPSNLTYLGGGAFYNCTSLKSIEIPNSVTYIGGEAFYNAYNLKSVKLPKNLSEIRGSTFENCTSLESIEIPDSVVRIGGHAFYGNSSLSNVSIGQNSKLTEIGSSAFRMCDNLYKIILPPGVYVNERAFKESPTNVKRYSKAGNSQVYKHKQSIQLQIGESTYLKDVLSSDMLYEQTISLVNVTKNNGLYEFTFNLDGQEFTLTDQYRQYQINDNLLIQVDNYSGYVDGFGNNRDELFSDLGATKSSASVYIYYN